MREYNEDPAMTKYRVHFYDGFRLDVLGKDMRPMDPEKASSVVRSHRATSNSLKTTH